MKIKWQCEECDKIVISMKSVTPFKKSVPWFIFWCVSLIEDIFDWIDP